MDNQQITPPPVSSTSADVRNCCVLCHASALAGLFFHFFGHLLGPLIVWLLKRNDAPEIDAAGKESLNSQISMLIYDIIAEILCLILIGIPFFDCALACQYNFRHRRLGENESGRNLSLSVYDSPDHVNDKIRCTILRSDGFG